MGEQLRREREKERPGPFLLPPVCDEKEFIFAQIGQQRTMARNPTQVPIRMESSK